MPSFWNTDGSAVDGRYQIVGSNAKIADTTAVWANSAAANTAVNIDVALPSPLQGDAKYSIAIVNPSAVTALTIEVKNKETFGTAQYPEVTTINVPISTSKAVVVEGWLLGEAGRLALSNDTVLGAADGFTANIRVRKV
jgi:hypothetical protein